MKRILIAFYLLVFLFTVASAQTPAKKTVSAFTEKLQKIDGFMPLYINADDGKIYIEISRLNKEFLYLVSLPTGVGSNPIGLDRGQLGSTKVVTFERAGNKVLLVQPNYDFRATGDATQKKSVEESFAKSVIWGFKIEASEGDRVLVDATNFLIRDAHGVGDRINQMRQGSYNFDESRSALYLPSTKGFPKNTEVEATITLTAGGDTNNLVNQVTPTGKHVTVRERQSFVELPDDNYKPRRSDPRVGMITMSFFDFGTKMNEDIEKRWIRRFRLEKKDPAAALSDPVKPIVYYVDNGAPKQIQDALIEGASWWNQAFEAAGFRNAFQVKVLPPDADPMDVRYNIINWVHRSTRGWSMGNSVVDPRTGEILKGDVTLDSSRARQDFVLGSGMAPLYGSNSGACDFALLPDIEYLTGSQSGDEVDAMMMARIRQLSAHEVGHTIGLMHNFAASTYGRGSVMDYPAPLVEIKNGKLDFSNAYAAGIGSYDKFAIRYGYAQFAPGAIEDAELNKIVREGVASGMLYLYDQDARPDNAANPLANLWDNGADPVAMLRHEMDVRRIGLQQFGIRNIPEGVPLSELENKFVPLYLHHRYQLNAAIRSLGGVYYTYSVREKDGPVPGTINEVVPAQRQREALTAILETIAPSELVISDQILKLIPPAAFTYRLSVRAEPFPKNTSPIFDPLGAAQIAADLTISGLLQPDRAARMIDFHSRDKANPDFGEAVDALVKKSWAVPSANPKEAAVQRVVQSLTVFRLIELAGDEFAQPQVRAVAADALRSILAAIQRAPGMSDNAAHRRLTANDIERFLTRPDVPRKKTVPLRTPLGDPIGN